MKDFQLTPIVGDAFEDLSISEMMQVQGSGDITPESTPWCAAGATFALSITVVKTIKGKC